VINISEPDIRQNQVNPVDSSRNMNQKLSNWASVAEIVSGIAVVVTLLFLIVGIRENTAVTRVSIYGDLVQEITQMESGRIYDPEAARVLSTFYEETTSTLDASERRTLDAYVGVLFRIYERAYFSREYDIIGDEEWSRLEFIICAN
jgi:hypothetical protein